MDWLGFTFNGVIQNDAFATVTDHYSIRLSVLYDVVRYDRISAVPDVYSGPFHTGNHILCDMATTVFCDCYTGRSSGAYEIVSRERKDSKSYLQLTLSNSIF